MISTSASFYSLLVFNLRDTDRLINILDKFYKSPQFVRSPEHVKSLYHDTRNSLVKRKSLLSKSIADYQDV